MSRILMFFLMMTLFMMFLMIKPITQSLEEVNDGVNSICYTNICIEESIDHCDKVIDLGSESVGFLTSEHFYYCDGIKITNKCLKYMEVRDNRTGYNFYTRCEEVPKTDVSRNGGGK